jgi:excisionase family DNA binding protein
MTFDTSPWLTTVEAADYLRTTPDALKKHIARGNIRPDSFGQRGRFRSHRFSRATLDAFVRGERAA